MKQSKKQTTLRLPVELHEALKEMSEESGLNVSSLITAVLFCDYLNMKQRTG